MMWLRNPDQEHAPYTLVTDDALTDRTLTGLRAYVMRNGLQAAEVVTQDEQKESVRKTNICWISDYEPVFNELADIVEKANNQKYNYAINYIEALQYSEYPVDNHYGWHIDSSFKGNNGDARKISFSILINNESEFEGGDLQFLTGPDETTVPLKQNQIVFFPSHVLHRVTPVTKGVRKALVGWVRGPDFV